MTRSIMLFGTLFFTGLVAGTAFVIWIEYNPSGLSAADYTAIMQHAIRVFTVPLPSIVVLSLLFSGSSSALVWREGRNFYLFAAGCLCMAIVALVTVFGNIPINNQIKAWVPASPPSNWSELAVEWWRLQSIRTVAAVGGLALVIIATLNIRKQNGN